MEVSNRFSVLASLHADQEEEEEAAAATELSLNAQSSTTVSQQIDGTPVTRNLWEIPEYVEQRIPSWPSASMQIPAAPIKVTVTREPKEKVHRRPVIPAQSPPAAASVCPPPPPPPHPYKFKASLSSELSADSCR